MFKPNWSIQLHLLSSSTCQLDANELKCKHDDTMNPPFQSPHIKTFHQTIRLVFDINSAKNGLIN